MQQNSAHAKRVLVVGGGSIGERHVRCLQRTGRALVGLCETHGETRSRVALRYDIHEAFEHLPEALARGWDSAIIATPAPTHVPLATAAIEANCAVLIEKPLAISADGVADLMQTSAARGLVVGVAYVYRAHPALGAMRDAIASGRFGRPLQLVLVTGQHFPTYRPAYASTYYASHAKGGGAIQDALTHGFNAAEWLVGPITRIAADAEHCQLEGVDVEDTVHAMARHGSVMASYSLNQHQSPNEFSLTVVCESGALRFELHRHAWRWMNRLDSSWQEQVIALPDRDEWFTAQENAWLDAVEGAAAPLCTLEEGLQTLRVNQAALASVSSGGEWVRTDCEKEVMREFAR